MKKIILAAAMLPLVGAACTGAPTTTPEPAPTVTVTVPGPTVTVTAQPEPSTEASEEPAAPAAFDPKPEDFEIGIKILERECFGSAGCDVVFRIDPKYVGDQTIPDVGIIEVTYEVSGPEDGPKINTFTIASRQASFDESEDADVPSSKTKLKAKVTGVTYRDDLS